MILQQGHRNLKRSLYSLWYPWCIRRSQPDYLLRFLMLRGYCLQPQSGWMMFCCLQHQWYKVQLFHRRSSWLHLYLLFSLLSVQIHYTYSLEYNQLSRLWCLLLSLACWLHPLYAILIMKMVMFQKIVNYAKLTYICLLGSLTTTLFGLSPQIDGMPVIPSKIRRWKSICEFIFITWLNYIIIIWKGTFLYSITVFTISNNNAPNES